MKRILFMRRRSYLIILLLILGYRVFAEINNVVSYTNPVIRGYNPDPSICRVGEDYYVIASTSYISWNPGLPQSRSYTLGTYWSLFDSA